MLRFGIGAVVFFGGSFLALSTFGATLPAALGAGLSFVVGGMIAKGK